MKSFLTEHLNRWSVSVGQTSNILCGVKRFCLLHRNSKKKEGGREGGRKEGGRKDPSAPSCVQRKERRGPLACCVVTGLDSLSLLSETVVPSSFQMEMRD